MKIIYINWSPLQKGAEVGGGVNVYTQSIAVEMVKKGHRVYSLMSGLTYNYSGGVYLKRSETFKEVINYEIINSSNIAPGFFNYNSPDDDVCEAKVEAMFSQFLNSIQPDVVHFNNIEGFSANCIKIAKSFGARVIYSLHNYHPVCNQIGLLYQNREICHDFKEGIRCLDCIIPPPKLLEVRQRKIRYHTDDFPDGYLFWDALKFIHTQLKVLKIGIQVIRSIMRSKKERKLLLNEPIKLIASEINEPDVEHLKILGLPYKERRARMVEAINHADCVLAVSGWVNQVYSGFGVEQSRLHTSHIGSAIADIAISNSYKPYKKDINKPVKIIYLGVSDPHKGLPFFLDTLNKANIDVLEKIDLHVYAREYKKLKDKFEPLMEKMNKLVLHDGYNYLEIPNILQNMDVGIVPPIWWDNAPQVVFEMLAMHVPVLGANIGGIPDFVHHMKNGLLFEPGNGDDLIKKITDITTNPQLVEQLRAGITPMKTTVEHADELEKFYQNSVQ